MLQLRFFIHPSILQFRVGYGAGANLSCHGARDRVHPGQVTSLVQGQHKQRDTLAFTPIVSFWNQQ